MKVISLYPLWAVLLVHGLKKNETRSWEMKHRGVLLIHATQKVSTLEKQLCQQEPFKSALESIGITNWKQLPTGAIIGQVEVMKVGQVGVTNSTTKTPDVITKASIRVNGDHWVEITSTTELSFGDYTAGRWIAICQNHTPFKKLIRHTGNQKFSFISIEDFNRLSV